MQIRPFTGDRQALQALFELADDSAQEIASYMFEGEVLVAEEDGAAVGQILLIGDGAGDVEIKSIAVRDDRRGAGIGRALIETAVERCRARGERLLVVSTAAADIGNLRFYQRQGFRFLQVERDAFTPANGYPEDAAIDGIPLRDRVWLDRQL